MNECMNAWRSLQERRRRRRAKGLPERLWKLRHLPMEVEEGPSGRWGPIFVPCV